MQGEKKGEIVTAPQWTRWGQPRRGDEGLETAFHHKLVLIREAGGPARIVRPGEAFVGSGAAVEWSPLPWATRGRRPGREVQGRLGAADIVQGTQDRLFTTLDNVFAQLFEGDAMSAASVKRWVDALEARRAFCAARDIPYRHLVVPEGHAIYADAVPGAPRLSERRPFQRVIDAAGPALREAILYPLEALVEGRAEDETSHPHDVHCTGWGAYLIYRALAQSLPMIDPASVLKPGDLRVRAYLHAGDVARAAGLPGRRASAHEPPPVARKELIKGASFKTYQVDVLVGENAALPRLVIFRTSNTTLLFSFLMRHFSRIVAVASAQAFYDLIESERPAAVVSEMPERYFASARYSLDIADFGTPPKDETDGFTRRTGHALPLPEAI